MDVQERAAIVVWKSWNDGEEAKPVAGVESIARRRHESDRVIAGKNKAHSVAKRCRVPPY
ncbi:hypothetical protein RSSM_02761 [Rhodopirellula sallentina SM41]|uniref:Uncharacterized protein n=1 Tax=Rhodopirellula sallentina SM41 TaxID=1263870 RepID=M5U2T7_9BACT|nr:hypothetical protein RSSM_02761 [Rhodopirellula sallentina SM41]